MVVIGVLVTVGPSTEGLAAEGMPLKVAYEKILTDKSTVALVAAENARLIVVELVTEEMVRTRVTLGTAWLITGVPHLGGRRFFASHAGTRDAPMWIRTNQGSVRL